MHNAFMWNERTSSGLTADIPGLQQIEVSEPYFSNVSVFYLPEALEISASNNNQNEQQKSNSSRQHSNMSSKCGTQS